LLDGELSRYVAPALRNHIGWFDLMDSLHVFEKWLASQDERFINAALWYLEPSGLHDSRSARIAALISEYSDRSNEWNSRIVRIMSWGKPHKSDEMAAMHVAFIRRGVYGDCQGSGMIGSDFWHQYHDAVKESPRFMIDVVVAWFANAVDRFDDGETAKFLDQCQQNHSHYGAQLIGQAAGSEPAYFVEQMLPRVVATVLKTELRRGSDVLNRAWPSLTNHGDPFDVDDAILLHLRQALQWVSKNDVALFRQYASTIGAYPHQTFGYLLLRSWADNPIEFADECAQYLCADKTRLNIGYSSWSVNGEGTGECAITRIALRAISPYCSIERFEELEAAIVGYCDDYEKQTPRWRGHTELLILRSLDRPRISTKTALRIEELERKFPGATDTIAAEDRTSIVRYIDSPIPAETADLMTDGQWVSAMTKYDGSTDRFRGGPVELSSMLRAHARRDRLRFASLVQTIPGTVHPMYFSAILDGMCSRYVTLDIKEKEADRPDVAATPTQVFLDVVDHLHSLPGRPCGSAVVNCIGMLSDRNLPPCSLDIVSFYATSDPDPETDAWQQTVEGKRYYGGSPYDHGINCVRGQAATALSSLVDDDSSRFERLRPALEALSVDPIISVRTCAINAFLPLLNFARDTAVELFCTASENSERIWGTPPFERFVHYAIYSHYPQLRHLLQCALMATDSDAVQNAARQVIIAELNDVDIGQDGFGIRSGNESMRKAAVEVYAHNLSHEVVGDKCAERLEEFVNDDAEAVRQGVSCAFFRTTGERLLGLKDFIARYIESRAFECETDRLLHALEQSNVELPHIICRACERVLEFVGEEGANVASRGALVAHNISALIVRQYEQTTDLATKTRCLDLIDRMERIGYYGIGDELSKIDR
jgi:hypothetical protein